MTVPDSDGTKDALKAVAFAVGSSVPGLGVFVDATVGVLQARQRQKDEEFWAHVYARGTLTEERLRAVAAGEDDEFLASAHRIFHEQRQTADDEKRAYLAELLANAGAWSSIPYDEREDLLPIALRLTGIQASVLALLNDPVAFLRAAGREREAQSLRQVGGARSTLLTKHLGGGPGRNEALGRASSALQREDLIVQNLHASMSGSGLTESGLTELGRRVLRLIQG